MSTNEALNYSSERERDQKTDGNSGVTGNGGAREEMALGCLLCVSLAPLVLQFFQTWHRTERSGGKCEEWCAHFHACLIHK